MRSAQLAARLLRRAAAASSSRAVAAVTCGEAVPGYKLLASTLNQHGARTFSTSWGAHKEVDKAATALSTEPARKFRPLADKELWHEAWMYEDKFGSENDPIMVPSLEDERIIGVTDPEDETLVVWGILKVGEPPRQFIEGGEFYLLNFVEYIKKVGDVLEIDSGSKAAKKLS